MYPKRPVFESNVVGSIGLRHADASLGAAAAQQLLHCALACLLQSAPPSPTERIGMVQPGENTELIAFNPLDVLYALQ
jgi:hypothetical protein